MKEIGVRQLKLSLSATLRAVSRGQHVRVTLRGRPLADIVPAGTAQKDDALPRLIAAGRLTAPTHAHPRRAPRPVTASQTASELVLSERDEEL